MVHLAAQDVALQCQSVSPLSVNAHIQAGSKQVATTQVRSRLVLRCPQIIKDRSKATNVGLEPTTFRLEV